MKFKVGDKVRVVKNITEDEFDGVRIGDVGIVVETLDSDGYRVFLKIGKHDEYGFEEEELELYVEDENKKDKTYKGWEIVKMINEGNLPNGTILQDEDEDIYTVLQGVLLDGRRSEFDSHYETTSSYIIQSEFTIVDTRKKCSFIEAFEAFEDGEEIEDKYGMCYRKVNSFTIEYKSKHMKKWEELYRDINIFSIDAIKGDWYIHS